MASKRPHALLKNMAIDEISLVDDPANEQARVLIVKAKDAQEAPSAAQVEALKKALTQFALTGGSPEISAALAAMENDMDLDMEALTKALETAEGSLKTIEKRATEAEALVTSQKETIAKQASEIETLKKSATPVDEAAKEAEFMKSLPASVRAQLEAGKAAQEDIVKMREKADEDTYIAKAKDLGASNAADLGPVLHRIAKGKTTEADLATIETVLKAAAEQGRVAELYKSAGVSVPATVEGDPEALLKSKAEDIQKANKGMTYAVAYEQAMQENPGLYNQYLAKHRKRGAGVAE